MSAKSSVSTNTLHGADATGLPLDLWRSVLAYLTVPDLCRCACVCRSWAYLVASLDVTAWKRFYFLSNQWKHPNWPRTDECVYKPWRVLYREHAVACRLWCQRRPPPTQDCYVPGLRRRAPRVGRVIHVGRGRAHHTLRSALNVAAEYDTILVQPGVYDEQFEMSSKIPFELRGAGPHGAVTLIMSIEQNAATGRLCNLVLRAPWFTGHVIKVSAGHLQVDACVIEDGQISVHHPATAHFRYCTFTRTQTVFTHVNTSAVENCEFKQSTIAVEGYPKDSLNWSCNYLYQLAHKILEPEESYRSDRYYQYFQYDRHRFSRLLEDGSTYTGLNTSASSTFKVNKSEVDSIGVASIDCISSSEENENHDREHDFSSEESGTIITSDSSSFITSSEDGDNNDDNYEEIGGEKNKKFHRLDTDTQINGHEVLVKTEDCSPNADSEKNDENNLPAFARREQKVLTRVVTKTDVLVALDPNGSDSGITDEPALNVLRNLEDVTESDSSSYQENDSARNLNQTSSQNKTGSESGNVSSKKESSFHLENSSSDSDTDNQNSQTDKTGAKSSKTIPLSGVMTSDSPQGHVRSLKVRPAASQQQSSLFKLKNTVHPLEDTGSRSTDTMREDGQHLSADVASSLYINNRKCVDPSRSDVNGQISGADSTRRDSQPQFSHIVDECPEKSESVSDNQEISGNQATTSSQIHSNQPATESLLPPSHADLHLHLLSPSMPGGPQPSPLSPASTSAIQLPSISISSRCKLTSENLPEAEDLERSSSDGDSDGSGSEHLLLQGGKKGRISPKWSHDSESVTDTTLQMSVRDVINQDPQLSAIVRAVMGPVIRKCLIHGGAPGAGGVKVSQQGQCLIDNCELTDLHYAIRCLQNCKVCIVENAIHHCTTSGIFMRLAAHGVILGNDIYCTNEAGIDVRRNADPLIQCNRIHHSKRSGIAVLGSGCGVIKGNDIYQNKEAGIYVLYKGNPYIVNNRIRRGGAAGIAVNENGLGYILDNYISNNRWGGVDIRHGSNPTVCRNMICNGLADGIVVGPRGRGVIEGNTIKGNDGCGVWVMGGQPLIQVNQIYNNNDTGVSFTADQKFSSEGDSDSMAETSDGDLSLADTSSVVTTQEGNTAASPSNQQNGTKLLYNTIFHNNGYGVLCSNTEPVYIHGNAVHDNRDVGVYVTQEEVVEVTDNSVTANHGAGIHVTKHAKADIRGNGIYDNTSHGVYTEGEVKVAGNDVFCNHSSAIAAAQHSNIQVHDNRLHAPRDPGVRATEHVQGSVHDNHLYGGGAGTRIFDLKKSAGVTLQCNQVIEPLNAAPSPGDVASDWHLSDPPARPHITAPPTITPCRPPTRRTSMVTRVVMPSDAPCQQTSKLCVLL